MYKNEKSDLILPVVLWGSDSPKHRISQIIVIQDGCVIVSGSEDGQIIQWKVGNSRIEVNMMLLGHEAAITCLAPTSSSSTATKYISCCKKGQICLWDSSDGSCIETVKHPFIHRKIIPYTFQISPTQTASQLYCIGDYADVVVLDPHDLNILFTFNSRIEPDWINAFTIVKRQNLQDSIIGISISGMIKVWSLSNITNCNSYGIFEDESKSLPIKNVKAISHSFLNPKILLIVASNSWQILDINNFNPLIISECTVDALDGIIIDAEKIAVGFIDGTIALFQLPKHRLSGSGGDKTNSANDYPFVFGLLKTAGTLFNNSFNFFFNIQKMNGSNEQIFAYRADENANIAVFKIPDDLNFLIKELQQNKKPTLIEPFLHQSLNKMWKSEKRSLFGIFNTVNKITATLYISLQGKLLLGCADGKIILTNACEAIKSQLINPAHPVPHRVLNGHSSAVTCFIHPFEESERYDSNIFISGGKDFSVIIWNLTTATKLHCFSSQGGIIQRFLIPPDNCNTRILQTICSIADDNSVALLSLKEKKCILLASRQIFPIIDIHWRPLDDLMMVRCTDDSLYVWQMETANLDRIVTGLIAEEVIEGCKEQIGIYEYSDEAGANQATQMLRAIKNKNLAVVKKIAGKADGANLHITKSNQTQLSKPLKIIQMKKFCDSAQLLLFNLNDIFKDMNKTDVASRSSTFQLSLSSLISTKFNKATVTPSNQTIMIKNDIKDIPKLLLSLIYDWNLDESNDEIAAKKRGLFKPTVPLHFGIVSSNDTVSIYMPSSSFKEFEEAKHVHWKLSSALSTSHLIANIALSNSMAFTSSHDQKEAAINFPAEIYNKILPPKIQLLAEKWQDSCIEIRSAAQILLLKELKKAGMNERKKLISAWTPYLPVLLDSSLSILGKTPSSNISFVTAAASLNLNNSIEQRQFPTSAVPPTVPSTQPPSRPPPPIPPRKSESSKVSNNEKQLPALTENSELENYSHLNPIHAGVKQIRRNQAIAIVLLGVIGTEFPNEFDSEITVRATALSLFELLIAPETSSLPRNSTLKQSAIDLIGSGFSLWQPHLDLSKLLLGLLELATLEEENAEISLISKNSLSLIASFSPKAVITAFSTEVARYNTSLQTTQIPLISPLISARADVLRIIEQLIENHYNDIVDLIIPVCDILIHCLDLQLLKHQNFYDLFPPIFKLYMIAYCPATKKLAIGGSNGAIIIHELKNMKSQTIQAHNSLISSIAFSSDGKFLAVYASHDARITIWQTHQTFLGMGQSQMRLIKTMSAPIEISSTVHARLVWIGAKMLKLLLSNGTESIIQI